ncbi:MAG: carboxypeptidase-like regulatory domain-containing protein [Planctomycetota bacterium]|nr:carboxypeptidase-like regulatory domain-containing protein [Planctomycetota bacterium]
MRTILVLLLAASLALAACSPEPGADPQPQATAIEDAPAHGDADPVPTPPAAPCAKLTLVVLEQGQDEILVPSSFFVRWRVSRPSDPSTQEGRMSLLVGLGELIEVEAGQSIVSFDVPVDVPLDVAVFCGDQRKLQSIAAMGAGEPREHVIWLPEGTRTLRGRVLAPRGEALADTNLWLDDRQTRTALDGSFELAFPVRRSEAWVRAEGWPGRALTLPDADAELIVRLEPAGEVRIHVTETDGTPAHVRVRLSRLDGHDEIHEGTTDEGGTARLRQLPLGVPLELRIHAPGGTASLHHGRVGDLRYRSAESFLLEGPEPVEFPLQLPPEGPIAGRLIDQDGNALPEVQLCLVAPDPERGPRATYLGHKHLNRATTITGEDGSFRFDHVPGGVWLVGVARGAWNAQHGGLAVSPAAIPVEAGSEDFELVVAAGLSIKGTLVDPQQPLPPRTKIEARPWSFDGEREAFSKKGGAFELRGLMPGPHDLYLDGVLVRRGVDPSQPQVGLVLERPEPER